MLLITMCRGGVVCVSGETGLGMEGSKEELGARAVVTVAAGTAGCRRLPLVAERIKEASRLLLRKGSLLGGPCGRPTTLKWGGFEGHNGTEEERSFCRGVERGTSV